MEYHPDLSSEIPLQPFDDLVAVDAYGRGHRPDGKFLSNQEIEQIGAHQDQIRAGILDVSRASHHQTETEPSSQLLEQALSPELPAIEPSEDLQSYAPRRWEGLKRAWHYAKQKIGQLGDHLAIEHQGYRLSAGENVRARIARLAMLTKPELGLRDANNPVVQKAYEHRYDTKFTKADWAKFTAYEVLTVPVVRSLGVLAIEGTTRGVAKRREQTGQEPGVTGRIHHRTQKWLEKYEKNNLNPIDRSKNRKAASRAQRSRSRHVQL